MEHGVTELIFGVDLVEAMIRQGNGKRPSGEGVDVGALKALEPSGSAIECRLYAEDATNSFLPAPGVLGEVRFPTAAEVPGVRVDTWVISGTEITASFDPLIAKLMVWGETRPIAVTRMQAALSKTTLKGSISNLDYCAQICAFDEFVRGAYDLGILSRVGMLAPKGIKVVDAGFYSSLQVQECS